MLKNEDRSAGCSAGHDNGEELFPVVDLSGRVVGSALRRECHGGSMLLHPVVHLHLFNSRGELYLQRRPMWKDIQPGRWDTAVGGHVAFGETIGEALRREAREELGITGFEPELLTVYPFRSAREYELVHVHRTTYDGPVCPSDELDGPPGVGRDLPTYYPLHRCGARPGGAPETVHGGFLTGPPVFFQRQSISMIWMTITRRNMQTG